MIDLPKGWPQYCHDLKQMANDTADKMHEQLVINGTRTNDSPKLKLTDNLMYPENDREHSAEADAKWNRNLYLHLLGWESVLAFQK